MDYATNRLFSFIAMNRRGQPLISHEVIVNLMKATTTAEGLTVDAAIDPNKYPVGQSVTDEEMAHLHMKKNKFQGDWNYSILPNQHHLRL